jgi:hypothetical protein
MKGCPLIMCGSLDIQPDIVPVASAAATGISTKSTSVVVWRRENIAKLYDISEDLLLRWCILTGNDFTESFMKDYYLPEFNRSFSSRKLLEAIKLELSGCPSPKPIVNPETGLTLKSLLDFNSLSTESQRLACEYSLRFYNLEDLTPFYDPKYESASSQSDSELDGYADIGVFLSREDKSFIQSWFQDNIYYIEVEGIPELTLRFLKGFHQYLKQNQSLESLISSSSKDAPEDNRNLEQTVNDMGKIISDDHIDSFKEMITLLHRQLELLPQQELVRSMEATAYSAIPLRWENVCAANFFQLIVMEITKLVNKEWSKSCTSSVIIGSNLGGAINSLKSVYLQPHLVYSGKVFHLLMKAKDELRAKAEASTKPAQPLVQPNANPASENPDMLPIDHHRETILKRIARDQITILHGETG